MSERDDHIRRIMEQGKREKNSSANAPLRVRRAVPAPNAKPSSDTDSQSKKTKAPAQTAKRAGATAYPKPNQISSAKTKLSASAKREQLRKQEQVKSAGQTTNPTKTKQTKTEQEPKEKRQFIWAGLVFLFFAGFLLLATVSYFKYWQVDHDIASWDLMFSFSTHPAMNWCGKLGAIVAQSIIGEWFGVFGVLSSVVAFVIAIKLFRLEGARLHKWLRSLLLVMFTGSIVCGHFLGIDTQVFGSGWGGEMGIYVSEWLTLMIGYEGTTLLLVLVALAILYYVNEKFVRDTYGRVRKTIADFKLKRDLQRETERLRMQELALEQARKREMLRAQQAAMAAAATAAMATQSANAAEMRTSQSDDNEDVEVAKGEFIDSNGEAIGVTDKAESKEGSLQTNTVAEPIKNNTESANIIEEKPNQEQTNESYNPQFELLELENGMQAVVTGFDDYSGETQFLYFDAQESAMMEHLKPEDVATSIVNTAVVDNRTNVQEQSVEISEEELQGENESNDTDSDDDENPFSVVERRDEQPVAATTIVKEEALMVDEPVRSVVTSGEVVNNMVKSTAQGGESNTPIAPLEPSLKITRPIESEPLSELQSSQPKQPQIIEEDLEQEEEVDDITINNMELYDPTLELRSYMKPPVELLKDHSREVIVTDQELIDNKNRIVYTLETFGIKIDTIDVVVGPTITLYEIVPAPGIRISKIKNLEDDIAMALSALGIRIIAPIPGKGTIGIEVPNKDKNIVSMYSVIKSARFQESTAALPVALGKTIQNETFVIDLAKMPHLLVAGATGQGKSVGLNAIITSLIYKKHPSELKFVLVDPKKVELTLYAKLENHFLAKIPDADEAIITDNQKVIYTLNSICIEMDARYLLLKEARVRSIKEYNDKFTRRRLNPEKGHRFLPYFVVVIDEFADLIMTSGREVETPIARIAQLARAVGIHLIIATQRPTTNIITGVIKANFPARIAFRVTSQIDSRTILDQTGANQLVGQGDMLVSTGNDVTRVQCAFVDTPEVEMIVDHIAAQRGYEGAYELPDYQPESDGGGGSSREDMGKRDPLFEEVAYYVVSNQSGSTSTIQRKFSIGFNRAGRIVDQLEAAGILGPSQGGSKPRQVLVSDHLIIENIIENM